MWYDDSLILCLCWQSWIHEKAKVIESTDELGNDLAGVMTLQRRLSGMERDLAAIQAKVNSVTVLYEMVKENKTTWKY